MGSSTDEGAAVDDGAAVEAAAVEDDADVTRDRGCSGPTPGKLPEAAAPRRAFINCCCCSSDQTEGSGGADPRPAALKGDVCVPLTLRVPGVEAGGVGMSDVSPTKLVRPRLGNADAVCSVRWAVDGEQEVTYHHACRMRHPRRGRRW